MIESSEVRKLILVAGEPVGAVLLPLHQKRVEVERPVGSYSKYLPSRAVIRLR
jgi:hypothetical protein